MYYNVQNRGKFVRVLVRCFVLFAYSSIAISFYAVFGTGFLLADLNQWLAVRLSTPAGLVGRLHLGLPWSATTELFASISYAGTLVSLTSLALLDWMGRSGLRAPNRDLKTLPAHRRAQAEPDESVSDDESEASSGPSFLGSATLLTVIPTEPDLRCGVKEKEQ